VKLIQWHAPNQILGLHANKPELYASNILAVSEGETHEQIDRLAKFINHHHGSPMPLSSIEPSNVTPIEFYLDDPEAPAWSPVAISSNQMVFNFQPAGIFKV